MSAKYHLVICSAKTIFTSAKKKNLKKICEMFLHFQRLQKSVLFPTKRIFLFCGQIQISFPEKGGLFYLFHSHDFSSKAIFLFFFAGRPNMMKPSFSRVEAERKAIKGCACSNLRLGHQNPPRPIWYGGWLVYCKKGTRTCQNKRREKDPFQPFFGLFLPFSRFGSKELHWHEEIQVPSYDVY